MSERLGKVINVPARVAHWPKSRFGQFALAFHQTVKKAIEGLLPVPGVDGHGDVNGQGPILTNAVNAVVAPALRRPDSPTEKDESREWPRLASGRRPLLSGQEPVSRNRARRRHLTGKG